MGSGLLRFGVEGAGGVRCHLTDERAEQTRAVDMTIVRLNALPRKLHRGPWAADFPVETEDCE